MGLILPGGPSWAYCTNNLLRSVFTNTATFGTQVAAGASNADGTAVTLLPALSHDAEYLRLGMGTTKTSDVNNNCLADILIDPAGGTSWSILIPSLACTPLANLQLASTAPIGPSGYYDFPIWIPAGASIGMQARTAAAATPQTLAVFAQAQGGNANPATWWCGQRVSAIGVDAANSRGTSHTPAAGLTVTGAANNGSGLIRLTVTSNTVLQTGDVRTVAGVLGTTEANGTWTITKITATTYDLQGSTFTNAYSSGGQISSDFSAWANLGSPLGEACGALQFAAMGEHTFGASWGNGHQEEWQFGAASVQIGPSIFRAVTSSENGWWLTTGPIFKRLAAGTQLMARGRQIALTTAIAKSICAYAVH
jgi:hypothetical protein